MEELRNRKEENNIRKEDFQSDLVKPDQARPDYYPYNQEWLDWAFE